jgi:hypothetical protein
MTGIDTAALNAKIRKLVPGYMRMGADGMGKMSSMEMAVPRNSIPMAGAPGQFDTITMGGMFKLLKVRDEIPADGSDPRWYQSPTGTVSSAVSAGDLKRDGIEV